jgi:hypothetical protein
VHGVILMNEDKLSRSDATRQAMYVLCKAEARSRNNCYRGKAMSINILGMCLYSCLSYTECKLHLFCIV